MIAWTLYLTFIGALICLAGPRKLARQIALLTTSAGTVLPLVALAQVNDGLMHTVVRVPWIASLGIDFHLAADGISLVMALVTGISGLAAVLLSWHVDKRENEFFFWLLLVVGGSFGVFLSADLFLLVAFYELVIIPKFFLISIWGSVNREYGAMKLSLYSFLGGALMLIPVAYTVAVGGSFDLATLSQTNFTTQSQSWLFPMMFLGFAVLAGVWPLHTWAPTGHAAAPVAGSMLLAGIVMKLGAYAALRVPMALFPDGFEMWRGAIAMLAVIGILYGAAVALRQNDIKLVIGYSSVSHMGFVLLGLASGQILGASGAVFQMFSHGVIAGLLFGLAGGIIYSRTHTRDLRELAGMNLRKTMPFAAVTFTLAGAASMGIPGFSGFPAEITVLIGAWNNYPWLVVVTVIGLVLTAAFTLRAVKLTFYTEPSTDAGHHPFAPVSLAEKAGIVLLLAFTLIAGLCPDLLFRRIQPCLELLRIFQS